MDGDENDTTITKIWIVVGEFELVGHALFTLVQYYVYTLLISKFPLRIDMLCRQK